MKGQASIELPNVIEMGIVLSIRNKLVLTSKGDRPTFRKKEGSNQKNTTAMVQVNQCSLDREVMSH